MFRRAFDEQKKSLGLSATDDPDPANTGRCPGISAIEIYATKARSLIPGPSSARQVKKSFEINKLLDPPFRGKNIIT